jgi:hypothetical protein
MKTFTFLSRQSISFWLFLILFLMVGSGGLQADESGNGTSNLTVTEGMVLRLDATTIEGLTTGDQVNDWADLSEKGNHAQSASNAPVYQAVNNSFGGQPSVNFSGSAQYLQIPHSESLDLDELTMFVVFRNETTMPEDFGIITSKETGSSPWTNRNWWLAVQRGEGELWFRTSSGGNSTSINDLQDQQTNYLAGEAHLVSVSLQNSGSALFVDGAQKASTIYSNPDTQNAPVRIGASGANTPNRFFRGAIGEIIIYNRALSLEERQVVEIYLGNKWLGWDAEQFFYITASAGPGGQIIPNGDIEIAQGNSVSFTITPNAPFYEIAEVIIDETPLDEPVSEYTFHDIQKNHTIRANFNPLNPTIKITASASENGNISPEGDVWKYAGQNQTFTFSPEGNYGVANVIINGVPKGPMSSYTFTNLLEDQTIHVEFDITGPMIHLDADAISGSHGDAITTWEDQSGYGNHAAQSNNNFKPILIAEGGLNGRQVVRFDGSNDVLNVGNNFSLDMDQITMFLVYRSTPQDDYSNEIGVITAKSRGWTNRSWWLAVNNNFSAGGSEAGIDPGAIWFRTSSGGSIANTLYHNGTYNDGNAYMVSVVVPPTANNETSKLYIDGDQKHETGSSAIDHAENQVMRIGAGTTNNGSTERWFDGDIAELIIYNRALSDEERQAMEQALQAKWFGPQTPEIIAWPAASDIIYGDPVSESSLTGGDANVDGEFSFKFPETVPDAAGTYTAEVVFTPDDENQWETVEGTVEITVLKKALTITAGDKDKVYDAAVFPYEGFTVSYDGFVDGEDASVLGGTLAYVGTAIEAVNAGTYVITPEGLTSGNYEIDFVNGELEIKKANAVITVNGYTGVYDGNAHGATGEAIGVEGEILEGLDLGATFTDVPGGTAYWTFTDETGNYNDASGSVEIVINAKPATLEYIGTRLVATGTDDKAVLELRVLVTTANTPELLVGEIITFNIEQLDDNNEVIISGESEEGTISIAITEDFEDESIITYPLDVKLGSEAYRQLTMNISIGPNFIGTEHVVAVVYKPSGDHVTGGGFIALDEGHYAVDGFPAAEGSQYNFGFNLKYHPKKQELQGNMNLILRGENGQPFHFKSTQPLGLAVYNSVAGEGYENAKGAQFAFEGNITRGNQMPYPNVKIQVSIIDQGNDGIGDEIGIMIWDQHNNVIFSSNWDGYNTLRDFLGGGEVVIHSGGIAGGPAIVFDLDAFGLREVENESALTYTVFPNPFRERLNFRFVPEHDTRAVLELYDMNGALIQTLFDDAVSGGQQYEVVYLPQLRQTGMVFYRLVMGNKVSTGRVLYQR